MLIKRLTGSLLTTTAVWLGNIASFSILAGCAVFTEPADWVVKPDPNYKRTGTLVMRDGVNVMESANPNIDCPNELGVMANQGHRLGGCGLKLGDTWFIIVPYGVTLEKRQSIAHEQKHVTEEDFHQ